MIFLVETSLQPYNGDLDLSISNHRVMVESTRASYNVERLLANNIAPQMFFKLRLNYI